MVFLSDLPGLIENLHLPRESKYKFELIVYILHIQITCEHVHGVCCKRKPKPKRKPKRKPKP